MTGLLAHAPTEAELERLYRELAEIGAPSVGRVRPWPYRPRGREALLALGAEMLRYDPRLLSVLVQLFVRRWREFHPIALRDRMREMRWPQALLVMLEFARHASPDVEFHRLCGYLAGGWPRVDPAERFFIDAERPASRMGLRNLGRNLKPYARWGFVGTERPVVDPITKRTVGHYDAATRRRILAEFAERNERFSLADYLEAVDHAVSRQQALLDLKRSRQLVSEGKGRGAVWKRRRSLNPAGRTRRSTRAGPPSRPR